MAKSTPSLLALLGLVAIAGYQNRTRVSDMLADARQNAAAEGRHSGPTGSSLESRDDVMANGGFVAEIARMFHTGDSGSSVASGLADLVSRFRSSGWGKPVNSWVSIGPNLPMEADDIRGVIGEETLSELSARTGMTEDQLLARLTDALPDVVNQLTPAGRVPSQVEALSLI